MQTIVDPKEAAESAGLRYVSDTRPGIRRRKSGKGFTYSQADGSRLTEADVLRRIKSLAIPPAWTDVWICPSADGHIQATGRDAKGRKQYRYHERFERSARAPNTKHVVAFAEALPAIRAKVREHMALRGLPREKVLATVVHLLETTLIRVGNDDYAKQNNSYGLTTLKTRQCVMETRWFRFTGKSGKQWSLRVRDRRIAKIIRACQDLPGQELLQYLDDEGKPQDVTSASNRNRECRLAATICGNATTSRGPHVISRWQPRPGDQVSSPERTARGLGPSQTGGRWFGDVAWATGARALARCAGTFPTEDPQVVHAA